MQPARSTGAGRAWTVRLSRQKKGLCFGAEPNGPVQAGHEMPSRYRPCGTPLGLCLSRANRHDSVIMASTLDAIPPLGNGRRGRLRLRRDKLHADKAYDAKARRQKCRARRIVLRIARKGIESSDRLGRHSWVGERTHAWFNRFRRLSIGYERRAHIYEAFTSLAASIITLNQIKRFC